MARYPPSKRHDVRCKCLGNLVTEHLDGKGRLFVSSYEPLLEIPGYHERDMWHVTARVHLESLVPATPKKPLSLLSLVTTSDADTPSLCHWCHYTHDVTLTWPPCGSPAPGHSPRSWCPSSLLTGGRSPCWCPGPPPPPSHWPLGCSPPPGGSWPAWPAPPAHWPPSSPRNRDSCRESHTWGMMLTLGVTSVTNGG